MVADTPEPARCLYVGDIETGHYDTGFEKDSVDFIGMSASEVNKILKDRKPLIDLFERKKEAYFRSHPDSTEEEFTASPNCGVDLKHGVVLDTSNPDTFLKLYLAFRGGMITPDCDQSNPEFNSSLFIIKELGSDKEKETSYMEKELEVLTWFSNQWAKDEELTKNYLQYVGCLRVGRKATKSVTLGLIKHWITDRQNLDYLLEVIKTTPVDEILIKNKIASLIKRNKIKREDGSYYFEGVDLGRNKQSIYNKLQEPEQADLLLEIQDA